jgi:hypothetical protein
MFYFILCRRYLKVCEGELLYYKPEEREVIMMKCVHKNACFVGVLIMFPITSTASIEHNSTKSYGY